MSVNPVAEAYNKSLTAGMLQLSSMSQPLAANAALSGSASSQSFQQFLATAIDQTVQLQKVADKNVEAFVTGQSDDIHKVMIATEKADLSFQMTMAVRNKMLEAYTQVMGMQF